MAKTDRGDCGCETEVCEWFDIEEDTIECHYNCGRTLDEWDHVDSCVTCEQMFGDVKMNDDATGLPINICKICKCQIIGFVNEPNEQFTCIDCVQALMYEDGDD